MNNKLSRRGFICSSALGAVSSMIPIAKSQSSQLNKANKLSSHNRNKLSSEFSDLPQSNDVVVIGSGYGGAIIAARLAEHFNVTVLERGKRIFSWGFSRYF